MAVVKMNFKGMDSVLKTINKMGANAHNAIEKALLDCHELITKQTREAVRKGVVVTSQLGRICGVMGCRFVLHSLWSLLISLTIFSLLSQ